MILDAGMGKPQSGPPEGQEMLILSFPDGAEMRLCPTVIKEKSRERDVGLFVRYVSKDGQIWQYDTDRITPEKLFESLR